MQTSELTSQFIDIHQIKLYHLSHNLKDFCLSWQVNFKSANLWSFLMIFCSSVLVRQNSCVKEFNLSVDEVDK